MLDRQSHQRRATVVLAVVLFKLLLISSQLPCQTLARVAGFGPARFAGHVFAGVWLVATLARPDPQDEATIRRYP